MENMWEGLRPRWVVPGWITLVGVAILILWVMRAVIIRLMSFVLCRILGLLIPVMGVLLIKGGFWRGRGRKSKIRLKLNCLGLIYNNNEWMNIYDCDYKYIYLYTFYILKYHYFYRTLLIFFGITRKK